MEPPGPDNAALYPLGIEGVKDLREVGSRSIPASVNPGVALFLAASQAPSHSGAASGLPHSACRPFRAPPCLGVGASFPQPPLEQIYSCEDNTWGVHFLQRLEVRGTGQVAGPPGWGHPHEFVHRSLGHLPPPSDFKPAAHSERGSPFPSSFGR